MPNTRSIQQMQGQSRQFVIPCHDHQQSSQTILKNVKIYQPATEIHKHNLNQQQQQSPTLYICRICLQQSPSLHANNQDQLKNLLLKLNEQLSLSQPKYVITTCKCQGTLGYVHQQCIIKWIDTQCKMRKEKEMKCQICLQEILYEKRTIGYFEFTLKNCEYVSTCNIFSLTSIIIILISFIALITKSQALHMSDLVRVTILILIGLFIVGLVLTLVVIVKQTFYRKRKQAVRVLTNDEIKICGVLKNQLTYYQRRFNKHKTRVDEQRQARSIRNVRRGRSIRNRTQRSDQLRRWHSDIVRNQRQAHNNNDSTESQSTNPPQLREQQIVVQSLRIIPNSFIRSIQVRPRMQQ